MIRGEERRRAREARSGREGARCSGRRADSVGPVRRRPGLIGLIFGFAVGTLVTLVLVTTGDHIGDPRDSSPAASVQRFLAAFERYRGGTWAVDGHFDRFVNGRDAVLSDDTFNVQRPPEHLAAQAGRVNALAAGQRIVCVKDADAVSRCVTSPSSATYDDEVRAELDDWRKILTGPSPVFEVHVVERCFELSRLRDDVAFDRYGRSSKLCFDAETGALDHSEVRHPEALDVYDARVIRSTVTDEDFVLPSQG